MSRPRKASAEKRLARLPTARVTLAELAHIEGQAEATGLTAAEFVRRCTLGRQVMPRRSRIDDATLLELNRIGVNLNQMARAANGGNPSVESLLRGSLAELRTVLEQLLRHAE